MRNFINDRQLFAQPVLYQNSFVCLQDHSHNIERIGSLIQNCGHLLIRIGLGSRDNILCTGYPAGQVLNQENLPYCLSGSCRSGRIVPDHGGIRYDSLCQSLHRSITDHGRGLVQSD